MTPQYFNRDISWLTFNGRVLDEAARQTVSIGERINFLSIFSSNLDEFYRVRIPALTALRKIQKDKNAADLILADIKAIIYRQQQQFGRLIAGIIPELKTKHHIEWLYNQAITEIIRPEVEHYFFTEVMTFLQPVYLSKTKKFFPENNKGYLAVTIMQNGQQEQVLINIPTEFLPRFFSVTKDNVKYIVFLDDIIAANLHHIFTSGEILHCHSIKVTRDAELDLADEYEGDIAEKLAQQLLKRDMGFATRFLYDTSMPEKDLKRLIKTLRLGRANQMAGGRYHNLKDLNGLPVRQETTLFHKKWPALSFPVGQSVFRQMDTSDFMLHFPYQSYDNVLRFFNEAALNEQVSDIFVTLYRIAGDSHIAQALISAAKNGKNVMVFIELKARFDEANNIRWAKKMKAAGVRIIYSIPGWKVHAKVALVKYKSGYRKRYYGLLGTGNFNESTARFYTDHILFTTNKDLLRELELLFIFLSKRRRSDRDQTPLNFQHLLVSQFNLLSRFLELIDAEIQQARQSRPAKIMIKLNNLEEETLINKLYEASNAGVSVQLIVRSVCRLVPGVAGRSENISVHRIVDRYLEHGRLFIFHHGGAEKIFAGSADWMNRNIYRRIEVCFPVTDKTAGQQLKDIFQLSFADNTQAVTIDSHLNNTAIQDGQPPVQSQKAIYEYLNK
ncbi:MAG TPA: polyphosphate kinase 1 [Edaphocola sp.]|nr:polyphosphate kinase 1 [Edaphocola sp.]